MTIFCLPSDRQAAGSNINTIHRCLYATVQMEKGLARLVGGDNSGKLAPVSEFALDAAAAISRSPSKATSLGRWLTFFLQDAHVHCAIPAPANTQSSLLVPPLAL